MEENKEYEVIYAVVNNGFADHAMIAARRAGAKGGTILRARGSSNEKMDKRYGLTITPEKEVLMILTSVDIKDAIMDAIYQADMNENNERALIFSMPVASTVGFKHE